MRAIKSREKIGRLCTSITEYPPPEMILAGEVCQDAFQNAEHAKAEKNAVQGKQGRRAGTGTVHGRRTLREDGSSIHRSYKKENR